MAAQEGQRPPPELSDALLDAERARTAVAMGWSTLSDAYELASLETELTQAYRRSIELAPHSRGR